MGISNSIGSNTFDILLCLGLPWFIKASFSPIKPGHHWVGINSAGLEYSAISLLSTLLMLYIAFSLNKFKLDRRVGNACLIMYAVFLILASLIELNVFFRVNLPTCGRWDGGLSWSVVLFGLWTVFLESPGWSSSVDERLAGVVCCVPRILMQPPPSRNRFYHVPVGCNARKMIRKLAEKMKKEKKSARRNRKNWAEPTRHPQRFNTILIDLWDEACANQRLYLT